MILTIPAIVGLLSICSLPVGLAQTLTSIRADGTLPTPTTVTQAENVYNINGGTIRGVNQFHSFDLFSVGTGDIASFNGPTGIINILGRVTGLQSGLQQSLIDGTLQTTIPGANLFLMNPAGVIFGPNATLNVGGSVIVTTADYLRLTDNVHFNAIPGPSDALLSSAPVAAFGFVNADPGSITVQGSTLRVPITIDPETGLPIAHELSLVGGDITVAADPATGTPSYLWAPSGQINLVSVATPGEVLYPSFHNGSNLTMGTIRLQESAVLDVTDNLLEGDGHGGTIRIRGGRFVMDNAIIIADTLNGVNGNNPGVTITTQEDVSLSNTSMIFTESFGAGRSGDIEITARDVIVKDGSLVQTITADIGNGGNIIVNASNSLSVTGADASGNPSNIQTLAFGTENGGSINIAASSLAVGENGFIETASFGSGNPGNVSVLLDDALSVTSGGRISSEGGGVSSGNITITADRAFISGQSDQGRSRIENRNGGERTGDIDIIVRELTLSDGARINNEGPGQSGNVTISADESIAIENLAKIRMVTDSGPGGVLEMSAPTINMDQGILQTLTIRSGDAGGVNIVADNVSLAGSQINSQTEQGLGRGGNVTLTVTNNVILSGQFGGSETDSAGPAGIFTTTSGLGADAGSIFLSAKMVTLSEGAIMNSSTFGAGNAGQITIGTGSLALISGGRLSSSSAVGPSASVSTGGAGKVTIEGTTSPAQSVLIDGAGSGIFTDTQGTGKGGDIAVNANSVTLQNGGALSAKTSGTETTATGGMITVTAGQMTMSNQALVTAETNGIAPAGTVEINTGSLAMSSGSQIRSSSGSAVPPVALALAAPLTGGSVTVQGQAGAGSLANSVSIDGSGSAISTATEGTQPGGSLNLAAQSVSISNGALVTAGTTGSGTGGAVTINAGNTFASSAGTVSSTASQAQGGDITITAGNAVTLSNNSLITATSTGPGNAGNILINAGQTYTSTDSAVTTQATAPGTNASGGNITVLATDTVQLTNSQLNASVQGSTTTVGGNIVIDPQFVILQNSQILAQATQGQGGNITITTNVFLPDSVSIVDASSQLGVNGTVNIQSPTNQTGGLLNPLPKNALEATTWINSRCRALAGGEASSFILAGHDSLPIEPAGWLSSPVTTLTGEPVLSAQFATLPEQRSALTQEDTVSLRRLTPPGFLLQAFAADQTDCAS
jgi:filamentous hemagglutinin family protein